MVRGIEQALAPAGFTALLANTDNDPARARAVVQTLRLRQVDGWISAVPTLTEQLFEDSDGRWSCSTARTTPARPPWSETTAPASRSRSPTSSSWAIAASPASPGRRRSRRASNRYIAYLDTLTRTGSRATRGSSAFAESFSERAGADALRELVDARAQFTAVLAGNDLLALGCTSCWASAGCARRTTSRWSASTTCTSPTASTRR